MCLNRDSNKWISSAWLVGVLLAVHALLLSISLVTSFPTRNEVAHLPAAIAHWQKDTFALYKVNPPLWRMLAVLPVLPMGPETDPIPVLVEPSARQEWRTARAFAEANSTKYWEMVKLSRLAGIFWSLLCAILIYSWSRQLYGNVASLLGLTLWCFDPNVLGHAPLLTPDMPLTVAVFGATYVFWQCGERPTWEGTLWCGFVLGLVQLTKFTALLLYFIWPTLWLIRRTGSRYSADMASKLLCSLKAVGRALLIAAVSVFVINMGYTFDSSFQELKDFRFVCKVLRPADQESERWGNRFQDSWLGEIPVPVPADYLLGIDVQRRDFEGRMISYLDGQVRNNGWWYYYLYAFLYKVPLGTVAIVIWTAGLTLIGRPRTAIPSPQRCDGTRIVDELFVWLPPIVIFTFISSQTGFNHHFRYVLPVFPFLYVAVSRLGLFFEGLFEQPKDGPPRFAKSRVGACALVWTLLGWTVASSLSVFPHSISHFNELAGGPDSGYQHLIDSNIDWGQDMWGIKDWIDKHPEARPFFIAYHNYIDYKVITGMEFPVPPSDPHPGYFAVDVHNLILGPYTYFQRFTPIAKAGYSIFIYHITAEEADAARRDMRLPPIPAGDTPKHGGIGNYPP